ncbi:bifunctional 5,10-methylenetetrahydrofolate dehydrogenase/5,10-methenyltetrahydrofolate cyclohydrolase [Patescibacteria group bacterium]|nr:bifunctional 5,10-methylenetetrahydrofolate dehydrogenase/5,10-methenyltetrahydrofolate cyclohydrolase [Patescibacteria group bacterium]MBU1703309.1 bifunctional 5,10-methylenetetrahydrofolate dehydrogenase/5,10-methenyltetrahydrofolate cyclohydrolase [Patescibacteria group bacterium]MBU1954382.1 bifunctional 5,10-methylenetetrahydrofolate dehydrogenase/5,10-methenyltetrahydrofolate cyclohydrolase [Patescibacteria group bacterium]
MNLLDGKFIAQEMYTKLQSDAAELKNKGIQPKLVIILVGDHPASLSYIKSKEKASQTVGVECEIMKFGADEMDTAKLIEVIRGLNEDDSVHGILVQLPLPKHIYEPDIIKAVAPQKDVDGFTAYNLGKMFLSTRFEDLAPCTPLGIIKMLEHAKIDVEGKEAVIVGRSNIVGKPVAIMLLNRGATVTACHSKTVDLSAHTKRADILVVAVGKAGLITADMVKEGAVVVDVGINRTEDGKLVGDCDFVTVSKKASFITPVPGGCGPMTVACLMNNVIKAVHKQNPSLS